MSRRTLTRHARRDTLTSEQLTIAWQSASLLLDYPSEYLLDHVALVRSASRALPERLSEPLRAVRRPRGAHPAARPPGGVRRDLRHPAALQPVPHLLRTRRHPQARNGAAAVQAGLPRRRLRGRPTTELPDHLCVVLEFAATGDQAAGRQLMLDHRAGLELLRMSLRDLGSPWAGVVEAVTATLPPLRGDEVDAVRRLAAEGPPGGGGRSHAVRHPRLRPRPRRARLPDPVADAVVPPLNERSPLTWTPSCG